MRYLVTSLLLFSVAASARAPWQWSTEERIAARLAAGAQKERVERFVATAASRGSAPRPHDYLEGRTRPELLMPSEIVQVFIDAAFAYDDEPSAQFRADAAKGAVEAGLPRDFVEQFERHLSEAIALSKEQTRIRDAGTDKTGALPRLAREACRARWSGIQSLRAAHGAAFDRFLYEVVAPGVSRAVYQPVTAESLRNEERGCR